MPMPRRGSGWIWAGRVVATLILAGLVIYLVRVGLDTADKLGSSISVVVAVAALLAPYLLSPRTPSENGNRSPDPTSPPSAPILGPNLDLTNATVTGVQFNSDNSIGRQKNIFYAYGEAARHAAERGHTPQAGEAGPGPK